MGDINEFVKPDTVYELNIGKSFYPGNRSSFHQFKYVILHKKDDFTPAAIDKTQDAHVNITGSNEVTIEVPHVEGSAERSTHFAGNKQPSSNKDCVLIFDPKTGKFTIERLESNFFLKKDRKYQFNHQQASQSTQSQSNQSLPTTRSITPTNDKQLSSNKKPKSSDDSQQQQFKNETIKAKIPKETSQQQTKQLTQVSSKQSTLKKEETLVQPQQQPVENTNIRFNDDLNLSSCDSSESEM